jgi:hypothetical protein
MSDQPLEGIDGSADGTLDYTPALDYTPGPGDPNYIYVLDELNYTPGPGDPYYTPVLDYTPGPGEPNYAPVLNYASGPLTITPSADAPLPPAPSGPAPSQSGSGDVFGGPAPVLPGGIESGFHIALPPSPPSVPSFASPLDVDSYTGRPAVDPYTRQKVANSSDISGTPTADSSLQQSANDRAASGPYGVPDAGVRQPDPADAGNWYTLQQLQLFQQNQQLSGQINLQLTYLDYLKATYSYGKPVPSIGDFISMITSLRPTNVSATDPAFISGMPPGGTISTLPDNVIPGAAISDRPIWAGLENTMFSEARNEIFFRTLTDPRSYLAVLPLEAVFGEVFGAEISAGTLASRGAESADLVQETGNIAEMTAGINGYYKGGERAFNSRTVGALLSQTPEGNNVITVTAGATPGGLIPEQRAFVQDVGAIPLANPLGIHAEGVLLEHAYDNGWTPIYLYTQWEACAGCSVTATMSPFNGQLLPSGREWVFP